jgi:hypothetical protein
VAGLTIAEVQRKITNLLEKDYLVKPQVEVKVREYQSQYVSVVGEVNSPGRKPIRGRMRLIDALIESGGFKATASAEVMITRPEGTFEGEKKSITVRISSAASLQDQINLANKDYNDFVGVVPDGFLFLKMVWPPLSERTGKLMAVLHTVAFVARDGSERRDVTTFKPRRFLFPQGMMSWDSSIIVPSPDAKLLYAFNGRDYLIEVVDLATGVVIKRFNRAYPKVPHVEQKRQLDFRKKYGTPKIEYEPDVNNLYPVGERLWVETSTDDKTKGRLIDVFDKDGRFLDNFYLGAGRTLMAVREDAVFCQEKNKDETITIVKYRIEK